MVLELVGVLSSLLLTPVEEQMLHAKSTKITLNGIVFTDQHSWEVWINGKPCSEDDITSDVIIKHVSSDAVEVSYAHDPLQRIIELQTGDTLIYDKGRFQIISGQNNMQIEEEQLL